MAYLYYFDTPQFGTIQTADGRKFAEELRRRFRGAGPVRAITLYKRCDWCQSAPCACPNDGEVS